MESLRLAQLAGAGLVAAVLLLNPGAGRASQLLYFVHADHLNTPRLIADQNQTTVWRWDQTDPFGFNPPLEDPDGNSVLFHMPLRLPGQYLDKETNLHYNYFRDYDPGIGRYVQSDPIGLEGGINTYAYVGGNPISRIDPLGLTDIIYDASAGRVHVVDQYGESAGNFPASNNPVSTSLGEFPAGTYPFSWWNPHRGAGANSPFGSNGNFIFDVPNRQGMGVHSGRANSCSANRCGSDYPTDGCIRTTDDATEAIRRLHTGGDPVRRITVLR